MNLKITLWSLSQNKNQVDMLILRSNIGANVEDAETASFLCFRH